MRHGTAAFLLLSTLPLAVSAQPPEICFAPGTPDSYVAEIAQQAQAAAARSSLAPATDQRYFTTNRWSTTATDGGGIQRGEPITLTWSVVADGTPIPASGFIPGESSAASSLRSFLNGIYGSEANWLPLFEQVFQRWSELTGISYVHVTYDDGVAFAGSGGVLGVRADIRIGGHPIDGNSNILAYNWYPNGGDMVFDVPDNFYTVTTNNSLRLRNVIAHEHGHGIGLLHVCPINQTKLMEPYLTTNFDGPQHDDILAGNRYYGDVNEEDDSAGAALALGPQLVHQQTNLSLDGSGDLDFTAVEVAVAGVIDLIVNPVGLTYLNGPQNTNGTCSAGTSFDSLSERDLVLSLLDTDGVTPLVTEDMNAAGAGEAITNLAVTTPGTYYLKVAGNAVDKAQLYGIDYGFTAATAGCSGDQPAVGSVPSGQHWVCVGNIDISMQNGAQVPANSSLQLIGPEIRLGSPITIATSGSLILQAVQP